MASETTAGQPTPAVGVEILPVQMRIHPQFDAPDANVTMQSSDGILFRVHRKNLEVHTGAFPGAEFVANPDEITLLTEPSNVLELFFNFVYPREQPDLDELPFELVIGFAEAVEKYQLFSAMKFCQLRLMSFVHEHALEILSFAIKHDRPKLMEACIPILSRRPLVEVLQKLPPAYTLPWCEYQEAWRQVFLSTISQMRRNGFGSWRIPFAWILDLEQIQSADELGEALSKELVPASPMLFDAPDETPVCDLEDRAHAAKLMQEKIRAIPSFWHFMKR